jgi:predicted membrane protein
MRTPHSPEDAEQEIIQLRHALREEKLKKADDLLAHRLVYSAIIFVILFMILVFALRNESGWVEWGCLIAFFALAFVVVGRVAVHYKREKEDAEK